MAPTDQTDQDEPEDILADDDARGVLDAARIVDAKGDGSGDGERTGNERAEGAFQLAPWQRELRRWLATLNPGRTQREYEKGVAYFFETPGVPQEPAHLTFELLLAYRGALSMRAMAHSELQPRKRPASEPLLAASHRPALSGEIVEDDDESKSGGTRTARRDGPLAPATVNLRLTALRQFLVYCALFGSLSQLSPDRIRAALPRLGIERRRPYQVLAEPEWDAFLAAARLPMQRAARPSSAQHTARPSSAQSGDAPSPADAQVSNAPRSPWGVPRAVRLRQRAEREAGREQARIDELHEDGRRAEGAHELPRSRAGLTGARTAQRDHALIALALATGLRAVELASLDIGDLSREWHAGREEWWLVLPDKKTKGQRGGRVLPLDPALIATLLAYIAATGRSWERAADRATPLFISGPPRPRESASGRSKSDVTDSGRRKRWVPARLSPNSIRRIVDRVETQWLALRGGDVGVDADEERTVGETRSISPHALRHSTAIALLEGNDAAGRPPASVEHVRGWLGHFDIRTTQGYLAHLEGRKHRRPFTLSPGASHTADSDRRGE